MHYAHRMTMAAATIALLATSRAEAQAPMGVRWDLRVTGSLGQQSFFVSRAGGRVPQTGLDQCSQEPLRIFRDANGERQEEVRVTCELLAHKVTLIQSCFADQPDRSFGAMHVDGISPYTIGLSCAR